LTDIHQLGLCPGEDAVMENRQKRLRRAFTPEFKAEVVELCRRGDRSIGQVARDLDLTETSVREWLRQADIDAGRRKGLTTEERQELSRLRTENRILRQERDILKRATVNSGGRCNECLEPISGSRELVGLAGSGVQLGGHRVQVGLAVEGQIGLLREVLA